MCSTPSAAIARRNSPTGRQSRHLHDRVRAGQSSRGNTGDPVKALIRCSSVSAIALGHARVLSCSPQTRAPPRRRRSRPRYSTVPKSNHLASANRDGANASRGRGRCTPPERWIGITITPRRRSRRSTVRFRSILVDLGARDGNQPLLYVASPDAPTLSRPIGRRATVRIMPSRRWIAARICWSTR